MYFLPKFFGYRRGRYHYTSLSQPQPQPSLRLPSRSYRRLFRLSCCLAIAILLLVLLTSIFNPSYTRLPPHYSSLRNAVLNSNHPGRGNQRNEKVFVAASLYDPTGSLTQGHWGSSILHLINLLGEDNVFLSIYENDSGDEGKAALDSLNRQVPCNKSIVYEHSLPGLDALPKVTIPGGSERIKRIAYLAEARNRALKPLDDPNPSIRYDKLLYLNDVAFDPIDALHLLFSTNFDHDTGKPQYRAACAVDFINPFKFYDTYATRDLEGYSVGLPFYPWFTNSGTARSRNAVLAGEDAVPVRSCWGGLVAFDAQFFQPSRTDLPLSGVEGVGGRNANQSSPARFRALQDVDLFWDASECCLIHADIQVPQGVEMEMETETETETNTDTTDETTTVSTGIFMNPFVRVAYSKRTLSWLSTTRRFEKLYSIIQNIGNHLVGLPWLNRRREEVAGQSVDDTVVGYDGSEKRIRRVAGHDGFCGRPGLQVLVPVREKGGEGWESIPMAG